MHILKSKEEGFTLLEILLVVAAIAVLAGITIVAINPAKQLGETRNAERRAGVNTILNAVQQYAIDNDGVLPSDIPTSEAEICEDSVASCGTLVDLSVLTEDEEYLVDLPTDPQCPAVCDTDGIGYTIYKSANGRVTVSAPDAELDDIIEVTQ